MISVVSKDLVSLKRFGGLMHFCVRMIRAVVFIQILSCGISLSVLAEEVNGADVRESGDSIIAKHRYAMGDSDTKSDASSKCFLEAKRKAVEYAGVFVESVINVNATDKKTKSRSDVKSIAAATVSAELLSSKTEMENGRLYVDCVVRAKIDKEKLKQNLDMLAAASVSKSMNTSDQSEIQERITGSSRSFKVLSIHTTVDDKKMKAQVELTNDRGRRDVIYYRFKWQDSDGVQVGDVENWKTASFEGGQTDTVVGVAPSEVAVDFRFEIKPQF